MFNVHVPFSPESSCRFQCNRLCSLQTKEIEVRQLSLPHKMSLLDPNFHTMLLQLMHI